jgi:hypothetical protein
VAVPVRQRRGAEKQPGGARAASRCGVDEVERRDGQRVGQSVRVPAAGGWVRRAVSKAAACWTS